MAPIGDIARLLFTMKKTKSKKKPDPKPLMSILGLLTPEAELAELKSDIKICFESILKVGRTRDIPFEVWQALGKLRDKTEGQTWLQHRVTVHHPYPAKE